MKNIFVSVLVLLILLTSGCTPYNTTPEKITQLPIIENMKLDTIKDNETIGNPMPISTYVIENEDMNSFLARYEERLVSEGWTIGDRRKSNVLVATQDNLETTIVAYKEDGELKIDMRMDTIKDEDE